MAKRLKLITYLVFIFIMLSLLSLSFTICADNFSKPGFKPVPDECPYPENNGLLQDNFMYKEWCKEISNIFKELYKLFARCEKQRVSFGLNLQIAFQGKMKIIPHC